MKVGESSKVIVSQTTSTGYRWTLNDTILSTRGVISLSGKDVSGSSPRGYTGVAGTQEITITCLEAGTGIFEAVNVRSWEFNGWDTDYDSVGELEVSVVCTDDSAPAEEPTSSLYDSSNPYSSWGSASSAFGGYQAPTSYNSSYRSPYAQTRPSYGNNYSSPYSQSSYRGYNQPTSRGYSQPAYNGYSQPAYSGYNQTP